MYNIQSISLTPHHQFGMQQFYKIIGLPQLISQLQMFLSFITTKVQVVNFIGSTN